MSNSFAIPWTVSHQAALSMALPRQAYWSGLLFPSPGHLPDPGIGPTSLALAGRFFTTEQPREPKVSIERNKYMSYCFPFWGKVIFFFHTKNVLHQAILQGLYTITLCWALFHLPPLSPALSNRHMLETDTVWIFLTGRWEIRPGICSGYHVF